MAKLTELILWGTGDWQSGKKIAEYNFWGIQLGPEGDLEHDPYVEGNKAKEFFEKISPYIPNNYAQYITPPVHSGEGISIDIPIEKLKSKDKSLEILREYFPNVEK